MGMVAMIGHPAAAGAGSITANPETLTRTTTATPGPSRVIERGRGAIAMIGTTGVATTGLGTSGTTMMTARSPGATPGMIGTTTATMTIGETIVMTMTVRTTVPEAAVVEPLLSLVTHTEALLFVRVAPHPPPQAPCIADADGDFHLVE